MSENVVNAVICIFQKSRGVADQSPVNQMLEKLQLQLKKELDQKTEIYIAFVYETPSLDARGFERLKEDTPIFYKEPCPVKMPYNLAHLYMLGMALLERQCQETGKEGDVSIENRLYLITDEKFSRQKSALIVQKRDGKLCMHPRFDNVRHFRPYLCKTRKAGGESLEEFIKDNGVVFVYDA